MDSRPGSRRTRSLARCAVIALTMPLFAGLAQGAWAAGPTTLTGSLPDGATYLIQVPDAWNGTLVLYSHGIVIPGSPNPARDVGDPLTGQYLLDHGYALAGSSYATTGWAVQDGLTDQIATLDAFGSLVGHPGRTIAWGHSLGGMITAGLIQRNPDRFVGALPMCGPVAGSVGTWNQALDAEFVFQQLMAPPGPLQLVHITDPALNLQIAQQTLTAAQATPAGRARVALSAALADVPGWFTPGSPEPAPTDYDAQENNQFQWEAQVGLPSAFAGRADVEARAGGNPSWNTGVNYQKELESSADYAEVQGLYAEAGLSLDADLATLQTAPRIAADPAAVGYLTRNIAFDGQLGGRPVLTLHTTGDGWVVNQNEQAYRSAVLNAKDAQLLRQAFVHRAGHCSFTPAETIAAFQTLIDRIDRGTWTGSTDPGALNDRAAALGPDLNVLRIGTNVVPMAPAFLGFEPSPFPRPFNLASP
jgi:pimeloyl-ACP methyl ester carboxylesterase